MNKSALIGVSILLLTGAGLYIYAMPKIRILNVNDEKKSVTYKMSAGFKNYKGTTYIGKTGEPDAYTAGRYSFLAISQTKRILLAIEKNGKTVKSKYINFY